MDAEIISTSEILIRLQNSNTSYITIQAAFISRLLHFSYLYQLNNKTKNILHFSRSDLADNIFVNLYKKNDVQCQ